MPISTVESKDLTFVEGNDPLVVFTFKADGLEVDLTGATIELWLKNSTSQADDTMLDGVFKLSTSTGEITIRNQTTNKGEVEVQFTSAELDGNKIKRYHLDAVVAGKRQTYLYGEIHKANV